MKKTYEKPVLARKQKLSAITADPPSSVIIGPAG
ncbi:conserved hypothetical protein [Mesorhizobium plurifarium]|uniref:RiPP n=1 Tax=Mesorhizobium plurifarium TaxID=69974 RepID=A0A090FR56_MESPL|nr:conserved hypothetical protein [Mesorhizobium plurifarium]